MVNKRADFFNKMLTEAQKKFGKEECYVASKHAETHYGIPIDSLALQYLLTSTVIPLERIIELSGPFGSGKSTLGYEIMRMLVAYGGLGSLIETENKTSEPLMRSVMTPGLADLVRFSRVKSVDKAQDRLTFDLSKYPKMCPAKNIPMCIMLDSLVGSPAEETLGKIDTEGHSGRGYSMEALMYSSYFSSLSDKLMGMPLLFVYTNHEKQKIEESRFKSYGPSIRNPGGSAPDFHNTYHIRVIKTDRVTSKTQDQGYSLLLQTLKNSMGIDKRKIKVNFRWNHYREEGGRLQQRSWFDWDKATAELLAGDDIPKSATNDIVQVKKVTNTSYNCPTYKMKDAPPEEVGKRIHADEAVMRDLQTIFGIFDWTPMKVT